MRRRAEGLGLLWDEEVDIVLLSFSQNHINVNIKEVMEKK